MQHADDTLTTLVLRVPLSFDIPTEYAFTTPQENAAILLLGLSVLEKLREQSYTSRMQELEKQLLAEKDTTEKFRASLDTLNSFMGSCVDGAVERSFSQLDSKVAELVKSSIAQDKTDRDSVLTTTVQVSESVGRRVDAIGSLLDRVAELSTLLNANKFLSSVKGRDNESGSRQLIIDTFGTAGSGFVMHQKQDFSGDHIFDWNGIRLMWEDKIYSTPVPKAEVEKAWRDFDANEDCRVLLFVSANTSIQGYESSTGLASELRGNRLVLYLSSFKNQLDPAGYIRTVVQTIVEALKPVFLRASDQDRSDDNTRDLEERFRILSNMIMSQAHALHNEEKACDSLISDHKVKVLGIRGGISRTRESLIKMTSELAAVGEEPEATSVASATNAAFAALAGQTDRKRRTCAICREPGHWSTNCPQRK